MTSRATQAQTPAEGSKRLSAAGIRAFFNIAAAWELSAKEAQTILGLPRSTFHKYQAAPERASVSRDTLERISYVLGIYKALNVLFPRAQSADSWIKRPNAHPAFNGRRALDLMLGGNVADLYQVRAYLDGQRGW